MRGTCRSLGSPAVSSGSFGFSQIDHLHGSRDSGGSWLIVEVIGSLEAVLDQQMEVITLIEDLAVDQRVGLLQEPDLAVLLGDQLLVHRRDLDVQILVREVEVGREAGSRFAIVVELDGERGGFVLPRQTVEVEESGKLTLAVVGKSDAVCSGLEIDGQV